MFPITLMDSKNLLEKSKLCLVQKISRMMKSGVWTQWWIQSTNHDQIFHTPPNQLCGLTDGTKLQIIIMFSKLLNHKRNAAFIQSKTWQLVHEWLQILSHITPWVIILKNLKRNEQRLPNRAFMWKLLKFVFTWKYIKVHSEYRELSHLKRLGNHCTRWRATSGPSRFPFKNCTFRSFCNYSAILNFNHNLTQFLENL